MVIYDVRHLMVVNNVLLLDEIALCYRPVGRYLFYLLSIKSTGIELLPEAKACCT